MFEPLQMLAMVFSRRIDAGKMAKRWLKAAQMWPELRADLVQLGGVLAPQPVLRQDGVPQLEQIDPQRLAYEAGRRDLAMQLLAMMNLSISDLNTLMEDPDA